MVILFIGIVSLFALGGDFYIYRRLTGLRWPSWFVGIFIAWSVAVDLATVLATVYFRRVETEAPAWLVHSMLWVLALFFATFVPKLAYFIFSIPRYFLRRRGGRQYVFFRWLSAAAAAYMLTVTVWGMTLGRSRIQVKRIEIASDRLPASFDSLKVVLFNDLHTGNLINRDRFLSRLVDSINSLHPDIVMQGGDVVNVVASELDSAAISILSRIESRYGVYSVPGNHDLGFYIADTIKLDPAVNLAELLGKQEQMGWKTLWNKTEYITAGSDSIAVSGLNYPSKDGGHTALVERYAGCDYSDYAAVPDGIFNIMLSHTPSIWDEILDKGMADLTLSGHVHAMQMKFGVGRFKWSPAWLKYRRWSGLYEERDRHLYINDGAGYVLYPLRINVRPEITLITLRRR